MLKIEIDSETVTTRSGTSERTGKAWEIREQKGYVTLPESKYPKEIKITLDDNAPPYAKGFYTISPASFFVGKFETLDINLRLLPITQQAARSTTTTTSTTTTSNQQ